jgi:hypothetical protein
MCSIQFEPLLTFWTFLVVYSKAKFESGDPKILLYLRTFWTGNASDKCAPLLNLLQVLFKYILLSLLVGRYFVYMQRWTWGNSVG